MINLRPRFISFRSLQGLLYLRQKSALQAGCPIQNGFSNLDQIITSTGKFNYPEGGLIFSPSSSANPDFGYMLGCGNREPWDTARDFLSRRTFLCYDREKWAPGLSHQIVLLIKCKDNLVVT